MKRILLFSSMLISIGYAQLTFKVDKVKHSYYEGYVGRTIELSDDRLIIGNSYADQEGNIGERIPAFFGRDFDYNKQGLCKSQTSEVIGSYNMFVANDKIAFVKTLKDIEKVKIPGDNINFYLSSKGNNCYRTSVGEGFRTPEKGLTEFGVYMDVKQIHVLDKAEVIRSIDINTDIGRKGGSTLTSDGFYYAIFGNESAVTLVKVNLNDGKVTYKELDKGEKDYSGGMVKVEGDKIYAGTFYGECSYNFTSNTQTTKSDGFKTFIINKESLTIESKGESEFPSEYQDLFELSNKKVSNPHLLDAIQVGGITYFCTSNSSGITLGSEICGPMLIWTMKDGALSLATTINGNGTAKTYPNSGKFFTFNSKTYLMYSCKYLKTDYRYSFNLMEITNGIDENTATETIDFMKEEIDLPLTVEYAYITTTGKILITGPDKMYKNVVYFKVDVPQ